MHVFIECNLCKSYILEDYLNFENLYTNFQNLNNYIKIDVMHFVAN